MAIEGEDQVGESGMGGGTRNGEPPVVQLRAPSKLEDAAFGLFATTVGILGGLFAFQNLFDLFTYDYLAVPLAISILVGVTLAVSLLAVWRYRRPSAGRAADQALSERAVRSTLRRLEQRVEVLSEPGRSRLEPAPAISGTVLPEDEFSSIAASERRRAELLRVLALAVACFAAASALLLVSINHDGDDVQLTLRKLAAGVPIAVLFGYLAKESAMHRANALWATQIAAQVASLSAFSEGMIAADASSLRKRLGEHVYRGAESALGGRRDRSSQAGDVVGVDALRELVELATRLQGAPKPGSEG